MKKIDKIKFNCDCCGKGCLQYSGQFNKNKKHFCGKLCYGKFFSGENNVSKRKEVREKISDILKNKTNEERYGKERAEEIEKRKLIKEQSKINRKGRIPLNKKNLSKGLLEYFYNTEHLTPKEIGERLSCSDVTIRTYLALYHIEFVPYEKKCNLCGNTFLVKSTLSRNGGYCSDKCMDRDYYLIVRRDKEMKDHSERKCSYCGKVFIPPLRHPQLVCCSPKCNKKLYRKLNIEYFRKAHDKHYEKNKEKIIKRNKEWRLNNPELYKKKNKEVYKKNRDKIIKNSKKWYEVYKEEENKRRKKLGLPLVGKGFMKEMELLLYIHNLFQDYEILTHHRKELGGWGLQGLELDIYIPELKLAFEYMGKQHYDKKTFDSFCFKNRTKEDFEYQQYRDRCKKKLCKLKGITLIKVRYDEKLSEQLVLSKIKYTPVKINQMRFEK